MAAMTPQTEQKNGLIYKYLQNDYEEKSIFTLICTLYNFNKLSVEISIFLKIKAKDDKQFVDTNVGSSTEEEEGEKKDLSSRKAPWTQGWSLEVQSSIQRESEPCTVTPLKSRKVELIIVFVSISVYRSRPAVYMGALEPGGEQSQEPIRQCHRLRPLQSAALLHRRYVWPLSSM